MATNIGIIVAVHHYSGELKPLPACKRDGQAMAAILRAEGRFDEVLVIDDDTTSRSIKERLISFLERFKNQEIGDVVFYFTGHGEYDNDEFFYLLSDYERPHRNRTSLQNSELDALIRGLKPELFVKMVDACQSGITYIKNSEEIDSYLGEGKNSFKKLYFMFSSRNDQASYQDRNLSDFTSSIIRSLTSHDIGRVRYKEVIDYVSDDFEALGYQTPNFVVQAEFTEVFCEASPSLKETMEEYLQDDQTTSTTPSGKLAVSQTSLVEIIKRDAANYCTEEEALAVLKGLPQKFEGMQLSSDMGELFEFEVSCRTEMTVPFPSTIGKWLENDKGPTNFFAVPRYGTRTVARKVPKNPLNLGLLSSLFTSTLKEGDYTYVNETQRFVESFEITMGAPYTYISVIAEPTLPNLSPAECFVVPIVSRTHLRIFWTQSLYEYLDFTKRKRVDTAEWSTNDALLKDQASIDNIVDTIASSFCAFIERPIRAKWSAEDSPRLISNPDA